MTWDYAEANVFADSSGSILRMCELVAAVIERQSSLGISSLGSSVQADAQTLNFPAARVVSTDPPYYDNIGYADLSDFFYVWLRRSLKAVFPTCSATLAVPKAAELVATPFRHGSKGRAESFFRRHDAGYASTRRAGASGFSGHDLRCFQAVRKRWRRGYDQYRMGYLSRCCN